MLSRSRQSLPIFGSATQETEVGPTPVAWEHEESLLALGPGIEETPRRANANAMATVSNRFALGMFGCF